MTSKDWTLGDAIGTLRELTKQIDVTKVGSNFLIDGLHASLSEVNQYLSSSKAFENGVKTTISVSVSGAYGTASLSSYTTNPVNKIIKFVDTAQAVGKRLCVERTQEQFDNLKNIIQETTNTIFWTRNGNDVLFYSGNLTISATLDFYYIAYPKKITTLTDYLEIKDPYISLVLAKTKLKIYEILKSSPPDSINQNINNQIATLRNNTIIEQKGGR